MGKRRLAFCVVGTFAGALIVAYLVAAPRHVEIGMTENEAQEVLGGQGVLLNFQSEAELNAFAQSLEMTAPPGATMKRWDHNHSSIHVLFDINGHVAGAYYPKGTGRFVNAAVRWIGFD